MQLKDLKEELADMIEERSKIGTDFVVIVLPEDFMEFIPEFNSFIVEIKVRMAAIGHGMV